MRERTEASASPHDGVFEHAARLHDNIAGDLGVANHVEGLNAAAGSDAGVAQDLDEGFDHGVGADFDVVIDHASGGIVDGDAPGHEFVALAHADLIVNEGEFCAGVGSENFGGVFGFPDNDALPGAAEDLSHIGDVILAVGVDSGKFSDLREQLVCGEDVKAGIDLANLFLRRAGGFLFDNGLDFGAGLARFLAEDAAVAGGVVEVGAEQRHGSVLVEMKVEQVGDRLGSDLRSVAGESDDVVVGGECGLCDHQRVAGAALLGLQDEINPGVGDGVADTAGFVTDDSEDIGGRDYMRSGGDYMREQRFAADFMQHFGKLRL